MHVYACYKHILLIVQSQKNTSFMQENMFEIQTRAESKRRATWRESHETGSNRGALKTSIHIPLLLCRSNTGRDRSARNLEAWVLWDRTGPFLPLHWWECMGFVKEMCHTGTRGSITLVLMFGISFYRFLSGAHASIGHNAVLEFQRWIRSFVQHAIKYSTI